MPNSLSSSEFSIYLYRSEGRLRAALGYLESADGSSSKGTIPPEAQVAENKKREREAGEKKAGLDNDSDDEELDQKALRNGELEG